MSEYAQVLLLRCVATAYATPKGSYWQEIWWGDEQKTIGAPSFTVTYE
jgi:hypothetical protein